MKKTRARTRERGKKSHRAEEKEVKKVTGVESSIDQFCYKDWSRAARSSSRRGRKSMAAACAGLLGEGSESGSWKSKRESGGVSHKVRGEKESNGHKTKGKSEQGQIPARPSAIALRSYEPLVDSAEGKSKERVIPKRRTTT